MTQPWHYHDGELALVGEIYRPAGPSNGCAVLVLHEADGIGGNVRRHCRMLAELGHLAAAADLHGGGRVLAGEAMTAAAMAFRQEPDVLRGRVAAGLAALQQLSGLDSSRIAAIGYCFGGMAALELARSGASVAAVASFHGILTTSRPAAAGTVLPRILVSTGARDPLVPAEDVAAFEREMIAADADWQLIVHGRARHSYTNVDVDSLGDPRMGYDAAADALSWAALLAHLDTSFAPQQEMPS